MTVRACWLSRVTKAEFLLFLSFWEGLSQTERQIFVWSDFSHQGPGWIGQQLSFSDVEDHWIGICGDPPVYAPRSQQAQAMLYAIHNRWESLSFGSGFCGGAPQRDPTAHKPCETMYAFQDMVRAMLGFDHMDMAMNFREERIQKQRTLMEEFAIGPNFPANASAWISENLALFAQELSPVSPY